jgi:hypothetical protein
VNHPPGGLPGAEELRFHFLSLVMSTELPTRTRGGEDATLFLAPPRTCHDRARRRTNGGSDRLPGCDIVGARGRRLRRLKTRRACRLQGVANIPNGIRKFDSCSHLILLSEKYSASEPTYGATRRLTALRSPDGATKAGGGKGSIRGVSQLLWLMRCEALADGVWEDGFLPFAASGPGSGSTRPDERAAGRRKRQTSKANWSIGWALTTGFNASNISGVLRTPVGSRSSSSKCQIHERIVSLRRSARRAGRRGGMVRQKY